MWCSLCIDFFLTTLAQLKQARDQSHIFNRKSISRNTTHRQSLHLQALAYGGGRPLCHGHPLRPQKLKKVKTVLCKTCFQNAQKCVFLGVILQNFPEGMSPDTPRMVVPLALSLKLICNVTWLWRHAIVAKLVQTLGNFQHTPLPNRCISHCLTMLTGETSKG